MTTVDRRPARLSAWIAAVTGSLAVVTSGFYSWPALAIGVAGVLALWTGLFRATTAWVTTGTFALFLAAVAAGVQHAPILPVLGSVALAVVAWDTGGNAISVGEQLGRAADTTRIEAVHSLASLGVGALAAGVGYAVYRFGTDGQPVTAVVFLLLGAILLVATLD